MKNGVVAVLPTDVEPDNGEVSVWDQTRINILEGDAAKVRIMPTTAMVKIEANNQRSIVHHH